MTKEEIARNTASRWCRCFKQFKEYLEKEKAYYHQRYIESMDIDKILWGGKEDAIELIINGLFKED